MDIQIDKAKYEGYVWWSDQSAPKVYDGKEEVDIALHGTDNPFIIEGNLWDKEHQRSISIRYTDGQYYVRKTDVVEKERNVIDDKALEVVAEKEYVPNKMPEWVSAVCFLQYWEAVMDDLCAGMPALRPSKLVFVGFKRKGGKVNG